MEFSNHVQELLSKVKELKRQSAESVQGENFNLTNDYEFILCQDNSDIIDVNKIDFSNDETWLYETDSTTDAKNINEWLYEELSRDELLNHTFSRKVLDTRTYTRPKKKFLRPSLDKFNEQYFDASKHNEETGSYITSTAITSSIIDDTKPLHFDLSQPASCTIFDNIIMSSRDVDSFQNMSPPSLVNSMCSSTFTNLMENSYIKNDPVLREIRDSDVSAEILMHDAEPQLYQSFTESCSSLNSDSAENFLRRTLPTLNATVVKDFSDTESSNVTMVPGNESLDTLQSANNLNTPYTVEGNTNNIFKRNITKEHCNGDMSSSNNSDSQNDADMLNDTFRKNSKQDLELEGRLDATFQKDSTSSSMTDLYFNSALSGSGSPTIKDHTYDNIHSENIDPNTTINTTTTVLLNGSYGKPSHFNGTYKKSPVKTSMAGDGVTCHLDRTVSLENEINDLSYIVTTDRNVTKTYSNEVLDSTVDVKRNSGSFVTGSTESLERMSSPSSRGSTRVLNMADVDAIVEFQERSLQIMSTPKPAKSMTKLFENTFISPIVRQKEHVSDSDLSSTDDYLTGRSSLSRGSSAHSEKNLKSPERPAKSMNNLKQPCELPKRKTHNTITRPLMAMRAARGSYSNARMPEAQIRGSYTNLRTVGSSLRGSYTSLRPVGVNLPVITPLSNNGDLDSTKVIPGGDEVFKPPVAPAAKPSSAPVNIVKPQARSSGLPRPVGTGIPKPVSRIPGPRMTRTQTTRPGSQPTSKVNLNQGYY